MEENWETEGPEEEVKISDLKPQNFPIKNSSDKIEGWGTDLDDCTKQLEEEGGLKFVPEESTSVDKAKALDDILRPLTHPDPQELELMISELTEKFYQSNQELFGNTFNKSFAEVVLAEHVNKLKELYEEGTMKNLNNLGFSQLSHLKISIPTFGSGLNNSGATLSPQDPTFIDKIFEKHFQAILPPFSF